MLDAAINKSLDAYNVLRSEILEHAQEVAISKAQHEIETSSPIRRARMITENMIRSKKKSTRRIELIYFKDFPLATANQEDY